MIYIYRKGCELEESKKELDWQRKFRPCDSLDLYEIMRQDIEIECYNQIVQDILLKGEIKHKTNPRYRPFDDDFSNYQMKGVEVNA